MFQQVDWLMNENAETEHILKARHTAGPNTKIMQCLAGWGENHDAETFLSNSENDDIGVYGFAGADPKTGFPRSLDEVLEAIEQSGDRKAHSRDLGNARNIEALRSVFKGN